MHKRIFILGLALFFAYIPQAGSHDTNPDDLYDFDGDRAIDDRDCAPQDPNISPLLPDRYGDGIDQNCDNVDGVDSDNDGFAGVVDCNDSAPSIYPGATEIPGNGIDEDCDGLDKAG